MDQRAVICAHCGSAIEEADWRQSYCSVECRKAACADRVRQERQAAGAKPETGHPCADCGTNVLGKSLRCPPCKHMAQQKTSREWRRKHNGHLPADTPRKCERCGKPITIGHHGRHKHCDECRKDARRVSYNRCAAARRLQKLQDQLQILKNENHLQPLKQQLRRPCHPRG
jgi:hypothetical protein